MLFKELAVNFLVSHDSSLHFGQTSACEDFLRLQSQRGNFSEIVAVPENACSTEVSINVVL